MMDGASDEIKRKFLKNILVSEEKTSEVENELHVASGEMREVAVERRKAETEGLRVSATSDAVFGLPDSVRGPKL